MIERVLSQVKVGEIGFLQKVNSTVWHFLTTCVAVKFVESPGCRATSLNRDPNNNGSGTWSECPIKHWGGELCWLHPWECSLGQVAWLYLSPCMVSICHRASRIIGGCWKIIRGCWKLFSSPPRAVILSRKRSKCENEWKNVHHSEKDNYYLALS